MLTTFDPETAWTTHFLHADRHSIVVRRHGPIIRWWFAWRIDRTAKRGDTHRNGASDFVYPFLGCGKISTPAVPAVKTIPHSQRKPYKSDISFLLYKWKEPLPSTLLKRKLSETYLAVHKPTPSSSKSAVVRRYHVQHPNHHRVQRKGSKVRPLKEIMLSTNH